MSGFPSTLFDNTVSENLFCGVCLEVLNNPQQCKNGHMCCKECLRLTVLTKNECPTCKCGLDEDKISCNLYVKEVVNNLIVKCCDDCDWTGPMSRRENHILNECKADDALCVMSLTNCCRICKGKVPRSQYQNHLEENRISNGASVKFGKASVQYDNIYGYFLKDINVFFENGNTIVAQPVSKSGDSVNVTVETQLLEPVMHNFSDYLVLRILKSGTYYESTTPHYGPGNREMLSLEINSYFAAYREFELHKVYGSCRNFVVLNRSKDRPVFVLIAKSASHFQFAYDSHILTEGEVGKILHTLITTVDDSDVCEALLQRGFVMLSLLAIMMIAVYVYFTYLH